MNADEILRIRAAIAARAKPMGLNAATAHRYGVTIDPDTPVVVDENGAPWTVVCGACHEEIASTPPDGSPLACRCSVWRVVAGDFVRADLVVTGRGGVEVES